MRTTESIIEDLRAERDRRLAAGENVDVRAVAQQIIAHQELAVLRERLAAALAAEDLELAVVLREQIRSWLRLVDVVVDQPDPLADAAPAEARRRARPGGDASGEG